MPRRRRADTLCAALSAALVGCASAPPRETVPADAVRSGWAAVQLRRAVRGLVRAIATAGAQGLRTLRVGPAERDRWLSPDGRDRGQHAIVGFPPVQGPRAMPFDALRGSRFWGWCARGVRVVPAGREGLARTSLVVDRLLVLGAEPGGLWGVWLDGLVVTDDGLRVLPWVPWSQAVERPRRDHSDLALWDCDLGERPGAAVPVERGAPR